MFKVSVYVRMKKGLLDPQGTAIIGALRSLGFSEVSEVRVGKLIEITMKAKNRDEAAKRVEEMSKKLLANPVIEIYNFDIQDIAEGKSKGK